MGRALASPYIIVDALDSTGYGAIHRAAAGGHALAVGKLLEARASVNLRACDRTTPLHHACTVGSEAVVRVLFEAPKMAPASGAAPSSHGVRVSGRDWAPPQQQLLIDVDAADFKGTTPLMACAMHGHASLAEQLLRRGAAAAATDDAGTTALMRAACKGHVRVAELLLGLRAPVRTDGLNKCLLHPPLAFTFSLRMSS